MTTGGQARALSALFGDLRVLVRPNGYEPIAITGEPHVSGSRDVLRVAHFGSLYAARLDITAFLTALQRTGPWKNISLALFGTDWTGALESPPAGVTVERHEPIPWNEVVRRARGQDLALALGNWNPAQLPSKAVQYLTLPIPRVAVVRDWATRRRWASTSRASRDGSSSRSTSPLSAPASPTTLPGPGTPRISVRLRRNRGRS